MHIANMGTGHQLPAQVQAQQRVPNPGGPAHMVATTTSGMGSGPAPGLTPGPAPTPPVRSCAVNATRGHLIQAVDGARNATLL